MHQIWNKERKEESEERVIRDREAACKQMQVLCVNKTEERVVER